MNERKQTQQLLFSLILFLIFKKSSMNKKRRHAWKDLLWERTKSVEKSKWTHEIWNFRLNEIESQLKVKFMALNILVSHTRFLRECRSLSLFLFLCSYSQAEENWSIRRTKRKKNRKKKVLISEAFENLDLDL